MSFHFEHNGQFINSLFTRVLGYDQSPDPETNESLKNSNQTQKEKIVFLHGLLGSGQNWLPIARAFEKEYTVLLLDQRGHGKSFHPDSYHPEDFADDLKGVLDEIGWKKVHLVGHSLGGRAGFSFAQKYSENLASFVIEDMGPHKTGEASQNAAEMIKSVPVPFDSRESAKTFFEREFEPKYGKVLASYFYSNIQKTDSGVFDWRFSLSGALECIKIGQEWDFWDQFKSINCPSLVVRGERSGHLPLKIYQEMLRENQNVSGVEIKDSGHWVHFEQKTKFVEELKNFYSRSGS